MATGAYKLTGDTGVTVVTYDPSNYALYCIGTVAASTLDAASTYQAGCIYNKTDGSRYENTGTLAVPSWSLDSPALASVSQTVAFGDFTDGGSTVGTLDLTSTLPLGAVAQRTIIKDVTGFAGDTSAVITVGDGTDVDRYNTGTPDVFTTIAALDAGAVSGTAYHAAGKTVTLTVTTAADWGSVTAGALTVEIFYYA